jgi:hypothetical protein
MRRCEIPRIGVAFRWTSTWLLWVAGCATPLEAPSAYSSERFLCGPEHAAAFAALSSACRETYLRDGSCEGFASLKGEIDGQPFVVDGPLFETSYESDETRPRTPLGVNARGSTPYFAFRISISDLARTITTESGTVLPATGSGLFGIEVRGSSNLQTMHVNSCEIEPLPDGIYVAWSANFARGGTIDVCSYLIAKSP